LASREQPKKKRSDLCPPEAVHRGQLVQNVKRQRAWQRRSRRSCRLASRCHLEGRGGGKNADKEQKGRNYAARLPACQYKSCNEAAEWPVVMRWNREPCKRTCASLGNNKITAPPSVIQRASLLFLFFKNETNLGVKGRKHRVVFVHVCSAARRRRDHRRGPRAHARGGAQRSARRLALRRRRTRHLRGCTRKREPYTRINFPVQKTSTLVRSSSTDSFNPRNHQRALPARYLREDVLEGFFARDLGPRRQLHIGLRTISPSTYTLQSRQDIHRSARQSC